MEPVWESIPHEFLLSISSLSRDCAEAFVWMWKEHRIREQSSGNSKSSRGHVFGSVPTLRSPVSGVV